MKLSEQLQQRRARRLAKKRARSLAEVKASAARIAAGVSGMMPPNHKLTSEQIDKAANDLGRDLLAGAKATWIKDGMPTEMVEMIAPMVETTFVAEFKACLRKTIPLHHLSIGGTA